MAPPIRLPSNKRSTDAADMDPSTYDTMTLVCIHGHMSSYLETSVTDCVVKAAYIVRGVADHDSSATVGGTCNVHDKRPGDDSWVVEHMCMYPFLVHTFNVEYPVSKCKSCDPKGGYSATMSLLLLYCRLFLFHEWVRSTVRYTKMNNTLGKTITSDFKLGTVLTIGGPIVVP